MEEVQILNGEVRTGQIIRTTYHGEIHIVFAGIIDDSLTIEWTDKVSRELGSSPLGASNLLPDNVFTVGYILNKEKKSIKLMDLV